MMNIIKIIKEKYYEYQPGEFLPVRVDGKVTNMREFHMYRIKWIVKNRRVFINQLTYQAG